MNHVTTPATLLAVISLAGFTACPVEPADLAAALDTGCPKCGRTPVTVRAYERPPRYRLILGCAGCGWVEEA
jgi:hypothetical protein